MACESTGLNDTRIRQFNKIKFWNNLADSVANYGVSCGIEDLFDRIDLACGAVPSGPIEQVVDLESPHQFLSMYTIIASDRFAMAVNEVCKRNESCFTAVHDFLVQVACENSLKNIDSAMDAFSVYDTFVLDGMPCDNNKEFLCKEEDKVQWKMTFDSHKASWDKCGGNVINYYILLKDFINALFKDTGFAFNIEENWIFTICRK